MALPAWPPSPSGGEDYPAPGAGVGVGVVGLTLLCGQVAGVMRHKSAAATMDQTDIRGLATTVHRSVREAASL